MAPRLAAPTLETASLRLRELALGDAEAMHEIYSDPETMKYWSIQPVSNLDDTRTLVQKDLDAAACGCWSGWVLSAKACSGSAGGCTVSGRTASCWGC